MRSPSTRPSSAPPTSSTAPAAERVIGDWAPDVRWRSGAVTTGGPAAIGAGWGEPSGSWGAPGIPTMFWSALGDVPGVDVPCVDVPSVDVPCVDVPGVEVPGVDVDGTG